MGGRTLVIVAADRLMGWGVLGPKKDDGANFIAVSKKHVMVGWARAYCRFSRIMVLISSQLT